MARLTLMDANLKSRLTFGPLLLAGLLGVLWLDWFIEVRTATYDAGGVLVEAGIKGVGLLAILLLVLPLANVELARLFAAEKATPFRLLSSIGGGLILLHGFATQFAWFQPIAASTLAFLITGVTLAAALRKVAAKQTELAILAMAGTLLATMYLGGLAWFLIALRVKVGAVEPPFIGTTF
ncbi:MAG: hypothetical protein AAGK78_14545, partial [Planctomycetota bacterium]